jgi:hypothetical protein
MKWKKVNNINNRLWLQNKCTCVQRACLLIIIMVAQVLFWDNIMATGYFKDRTIKSMKLRIPGPESCFAEQGNSTDEHHISLVDSSRYKRITSPSKPH